MAFINYHRWPRPGQYIDSDAIISHWPSYMNFETCIAPAINYEYLNSNQPDNPMGVFRWGRRLQVNTGMLWHYGDLDFDDYPLFKGFPEARIKGKPGGDISWTFSFDIIRGGITRTGEGSYGGWIWPFRGGRNYQHFQMMPVWEYPHQGPNASTFNVTPCTLEDMWEDSSETGLGN